MKVWLIVIFLFVSGFSGFSQKYYDFGPYAGLSYYMGEMNPGRQFYSIQPVFGAMGKKIFNERYSLKAQLMYTTLSASDGKSGDAFQLSRGGSFSTPLIELACLIEFNYLDLVFRRDKITSSFYLTAGLSAFYSTTTSILIQPAVPFGPGYKVNITPKLNLSLDWIFRKTFTDELDGLKGQKQEGSEEKQMAYYYTKDWYTTLGLTLSWRFMLPRIRCLDYAY